MAAARAVFVLACAAALSARPRRRTKVGSRRPTPPGAPQQKKPPPFDAAMLCQAQTANEAAESLLVPERCRGAPCVKTWYEFVALEGLHEHCLRPENADGAVLYLHTKGSTAQSRTNRPYLDASDEEGPDPWCVPVRATWWVFLGRLFSLRVLPLP